MMHYMTGRLAFRSGREVRAIRRATTAGVTLVEMMLVLSVCGLLTTAAAPTISRITTHSRVREAAKVVAQDLSLAVTNAARERMPMRIARGSDMKSITVTDRTSGSVLSTRHLGPGTAYQVDSVAFSVTPVDIFPSGFTSSALVVTVWAGGYSRQATLSRVGWARAP